LARTPSSEASPAGAAYKTVEGTIALARGDRTSAKSAFDAAVLADDGLAAAWAAQGDLSRSDGKFDAAARAYDRAHGLMPSNPEIGQSLEAAKRGTRLSIPEQKTGPTLPGGDLAPTPPPARACKVRGTHPASIALCRALDDLIAAAQPAEREAAVSALVQAWAKLQPLCESGDAACGSFVAPALAAAARAYKTAGRSVKSILTARMLLQYAPNLPESEALVREMLLELGDRYFWLGQFDEAANFYERYATSTGTGPGLPRQKEARERAALIRSALVAWTSTKHWARRGSACRAPLCGLRRLVVDDRWSTPSPPRR
jgi:tetratricopeptide (TPR) repeat protein